MPLWKSGLALLAEQLSTSIVLTVMVMTALVCLLICACSDIPNSPTNPVPILGRCWMRSYDRLYHSAIVSVVLGSKCALWLCFLLSLEGTVNWLQISFGVFQCFLSYGPLIFRRERWTPFHFPQKCNYEINGFIEKSQFSLASQDQLRAARRNLVPSNALFWVSSCLWFPCLLGTFHSHLV